MPWTQCLLCCDWDKKLKFHRRPILTLGTDWGFRGSGFRLLAARLDSKITTHTECACDLKSNKADLWWLCGLRRVLISSVYMVRRELLDSTLNSDDETSEETNVPEKVRHPRAKNKPKQRLWRNKNLGQFCRNWLRHSLSCTREQVGTCCCRWQRIVNNGFTCFFFV